MQRSGVAKRAEDSVLEGSAGRRNWVLPDHARRHRLHHEPYTAVDARSMTLRNLFDCGHVELRPTAGAGIEIERAVFLKLLLHTDSVARTR